MIAEAAKSMPAFDLLSKERVRSRVDQPAAAGGSRAAPEGHERGLEPGTSDGGGTGGTGEGVMGSLIQLFM